MVAATAAALVRTRLLSTVLVAALAGVVSASFSAIAACGDTVIDAGEDCDDGNTLDGDCCSQSCAFEPSWFTCAHDSTGICLELFQGYCDGAGTCRPQACDIFGYGFYSPRGFTFDIYDHAGEEDDRLRWAVRGGRRHYDDGSVPPGDPTLDTTYALCIYDVAPDFSLTVRYEKRIEPGANWRRTRNAWVYREVEAAGGVTSVKAKRLASVLMRGAAAALPGAVSGAQYFDSVAFGLVSTAGYCHVSLAGRTTQNTPTRYRSYYPTFLD